MLITYHVITYHVITYYEWCHNTLQIVYIYIYNNDKNTNYFKNI